MEVQYNTLPVLVKWQEGLQACNKLNTWFWCVGK